MFFDITTPARRIFQKNGGFLLAGVVCFIYFCTRYYLCGTNAPIEEV